MNAFACDKYLIAALKKGDYKAYNYLVDTFHHRLCIYALSLTNDGHMAEDIVQEVFVKIYRNRLRLKEELYLKSYLYKSVYNEFIDQYRKNKSVLALKKAYVNSLNKIQMEENESSYEMILERIKAEIENLPPRCKETFLLSKKDGLTNIEIAEYLNISKKTVEAHITKAFRILRKKLGENFFLFF